MEMLSLWPLHQVTSKQWLFISKFFKSNGSLHWQTTVHMTPVWVSWSSIWSKTSCAKQHLFIFFSCQCPLCCFFDQITFHHLFVIVYKLRPYTCVFVSQIFWTCLHTFAGIPGSLGFPPTLVAGATPSNSCVMVQTKCSCPLSEPS